MTPTLGILIATLPRRRHYLARLMERLSPQVTPAVRVRFDADESLTIGGKRQRLLEETTGGESHVCFIDDDDLVAPDYVASILSALRDGPAPDVVGFRVHRYIDGVLYEEQAHSLTARHPRRRIPGHLCPVRREMAVAVGFRPLNDGEDGDYAQRLHARFGKTMRETFVDKPLYEYLYRTPSKRDA